MQSRTGAIQPKTRTMQVLFGYLPGAGLFLRVLFLIFFSYSHFLKCHLFIREVTGNEARKKRFQRATMSWSRFRSGVPKLFRPRTPFYIPTGFFKRTVRTLKISLAIFPVEAVKLLTYTIYVLHYMMWYVLSCADFIGLILSLFWWAENNQSEVLKMTRDK